MARSHYTKRHTPIERILMRTVCDLRTRCWLCAYGSASAEYSQISITCHLVGTHRVIYEAFVGPIPDGYEIDHLCRVPRCCNPTHLEAVPHQINTLRGIGPAATNARKKHCIHRHEFTPENTYLVGTRRQCKECRRAAVRRNQARRRASH